MLLCSVSSFLHFISCLETEVFQILTETGMKMVRNQICFYKKTASDTQSVHQINILRAFYDVCMNLLMESYFSNAIYNTLVISGQFANVCWSTYSFGVLWYSGKLATFASLLPTPPLMVVNRSASGCPEMHIGLFQYVFFEKLLLLFPDPS